MSVDLTPCPICGNSPDRFFAGKARIEVIACPKGCQSHALAQVVHITSDQVQGLGWSDLGHAWNTIRVEHDDKGTGRICFDRYPPGKQPDLPDGLHLKWSPEISSRKAKERQP